jgi:hypothetical protein
MGDFLRFLREHVGLSFGLVMGSAIAVYGWATDAYDLYQALPPALLVVGGATLCVLSLLLFAYQLKRSVVAPPQAAVVPRGEPEKQDTGRERRIFADEIRGAVDDARRAVAGNKSERAAEKQLHEINALFLTLNKDWKIPLPPRHEKPSITLELRLRVLEIVEPLLRKGHDAEARREAAKFLREFKRIIS